MVLSGNHITSQKWSPGTLKTLELCKGTIVLLSFSFVSKCQESNPGLFMLGKWFTTELYYTSPTLMEGF